MFACSRRDKERSIQSYLLLFGAAFLAVAGFGGALLLLPLLTQTAGPTLAVPLLTLAQLIGNMSRTAFGFRQIRWHSVSLFLLGAVPCSIVDALSFVSLPAGIMTCLIGLTILAFVILRLVGFLHGTLGPHGLILGGGWPIRPGRKCWPVRRSGVSDAGSPACG